MRLLLLTILTSAAFLATPSPASAQAGGDGAARECRIAFVIDGDTVHCQGGERVRLRMIDTPDGGQFGVVARRALSALLRPGSRIRLEVSTPAVDSSGRTLGYLFLPDGRMVNEMLVRQGYAFLEPDAGGSRYGDRLREAEDAARAAGLGVWTQ